MTDILIVEDHEDVRSLLRVILRDDRYMVREAPDGATALHLARERCPDLVLLDLQMPGMDGREVMRSLKSDPATASARVVVVTGRGEDERDEFLGLGAEAFLTKPFSPLTILELVDRLHDEA